MLPQKVLNMLLITLVGFVTILPSINTDINVGASAGANVGVGNLFPCLFGPCSEPLPVGGPGPVVPPGGSGPGPVVPPGGPGPITSPPDDCGCDGDGDGDDGGSPTGNGGTPVTCDCDGDGDGSPVCPCPIEPPPECDDYCDCDDNPLACPTLDYLDMTGLPPITVINDDDDVPDDVPYNETVPRTVIITPNATDTMENTGYAVVVSIDKEDCSFSIGGVTGINKYYLRRILFLWNCTGLSSTRIIDGPYLRGAQLKMIFVYLKACYDEIADIPYEDEDGLLISSLFVSVDGRRNRRFTPLYNAIAQIINTTGSTVDIDRPDVFDFVMNGEEQHYQEWYYAYRGSSVEIGTNDPVRNATIIIQDNWCLYISRVQFEVFCPAAEDIYSRDVQPAGVQDRPVVIAGPSTVTTADAYYPCYNIQDQ